LTAKQKGGELSLCQSRLPGTRQVPERFTAMGNIPRLVLWLCRKFTREDLQELVNQLQEILAGRQPEPQPRDDFRQQHPHYRDFSVDPRAPLTQPPAPSRTGDWRQLRKQYERPHLSLGYRVPVPLPQVSSVTTLQGQWNKILALALAA
jgi:hypothetical protein